MNYSGFFILASRTLGSDINYDKISMASTQLIQHSSLHRSNAEEGEPLSSYIQDFAQLGWRHHIVPFKGAVKGADIFIARQNTNINDAKSRFNL